MCRVMEVRSEGFVFPRSSHAQQSLLHVTLAGTLRHTFTTTDASHSYSLSRLVAANTPHTGTLCPSIR